MASFLETYGLRYDEMFRKRCTGAVTKKAEGIKGEDPSTPNHDARMTWATAAFNDPVAETEKIMWRIAQNPTIQTKQSPASVGAGTIASDADIEFVVNGVVDEIAVNPPAGSPLMR